jgi:hypothetical protein
MMAPDRGGVRMKFAASFVLAAALLLAFIFVPYARAVEPRPGLWEVKIRTGGPSDPRETVNTSCVTPEHTKNIATGFGPAEQPGSSCTQANYKWDGTKITYQIQCKMPNSTSEGDVTYVFDTPTHYTATMKNKISVRGQNIVSTITMEGRRLGECPAQTKK